MRRVQGRSWLRLGGFELLILAAFGLVSVWVLALDLWQVVAHGRVWTGTDGVYLVDQLQYMAWVRAASHHVLVSNLFVLRSTPADYFQPAIAISGGLTALGVAPWLSLLLWKPVAVLACFNAVRQYVVRSLPGRAAAGGALVLALFFGSFTIVYGSATTIGDLFPGFLSWGYEFALLSLACVLAALLAYDRARQGRGPLWLPGVLGALASLLHPWHGGLLIVIVLGAEALLPGWRQALRRRFALPVLTLGLTAVPLVYYVVLGRLDPSWHMAREASKHGFPLSWILLALVPLLVPALAAYRGRPGDFLSAATRAWPLAALIVYALSATTLAATPLHAFEGVTVPLAVLAVEGWQRLGAQRLPGHRLIAAAAILAFTVPVTVDQLINARQLVQPLAGTARFVTRDERRALRYLARDPRPGGVISRSYLGALVPGATGRQTFVGDCLWSQPGCSRRLVTVKTLFTGSISAGAAQKIVLESHARFVLADCRQGNDLERLLGPIVTARHAFGCAQVYEVQ